MPVIRWEMQNVAGRDDPFFSVECELHLALHDERHLLVRMPVGRRNNEWIEFQATDHDVVTDDHLTVDAFRNLFNRNRIPVGYKRLDSVCFTYHKNLAWTAVLPITRESASWC